LLRTPQRLRRRPLKASRKAAREKQAGEVSVLRLAVGVWRLRPPEAVPGSRLDPPRGGSVLVSRYVCAHGAFLYIWFPVWFVPSCCWRLGMEQTRGAELVLCELMLFFSPRLQRLSPEAQIRCLLAAGHARASLVAMACAAGRWCPVVRKAPPAPRRREKERTPREQSPLAQQQEQRKKPGRRSKEEERGEEDQLARNRLY